MIKSSMEEENTGIRKVENNLKLRSEVQTLVICRLTIKVKKS